MLLDHCPPNPIPTDLITTDPLIIYGASCFIFQSQDAFSVQWALLLPAIFQHLRQKDLERDREDEGLNVASPVLELIFLQDHHY